MPAIESPYYRHSGLASGPPLVFISGLGTTADHYMALIDSLGLHWCFSLHHFHLQGHEPSPSSADETTSILTLAEDIRGMFSDADITPAYPATVFAHFKGCLLASTFAVQYSSFVKELVLFDPWASPPTVTHGPELAELRAKTLVVLGAADKENAYTWDTSMGQRVLSFGAVVRESVEQWRASGNFSTLSNEIGKFLGCVEIEWLSDTYFLLE